MMRITVCHQCKIKGDAKVSIRTDGYIVKCKCGNEGLNVMKKIASAGASWHSGHQKFDKKETPR